MKFQIGLVCLVFFGFSACSTFHKKRPVQEAHDSIGFNPKVFNLSSGVRLVIVDDDSLPVISYQTWVQAGSRDESLGFTGIAHLFEHLLFKNGEKFQARAFLDELEAKGAQVNAFTARDHTVFYETFVPELLDKVIELEADRFSHFRISGEALEIEKQVVMEERRLRLEGNPDARIDEAVWKLVYPYHPYRIPVIGQKEDIYNLDLKTIRGFFADNYHPSRIVIVVVGPVNVAVLKSKIELLYHFPKTPAVARKVIYPDPTQTTERRLDIVEPSHVHPKLIYAYPIPAVFDGDSYLLDVASQMMFGGRSTFGYQELVEKRRLFLSVASSSFTPECPGIFQIEAILGPKTTRQIAEFTLENFLTEFLEKASEEQLETAKAQLGMKIAEEWQTAGGLASSIGLGMTVFNDPKRFQEDLKRYDRVSLEDVKRVVKQYLTKDHRNVVWSAAKL